MLVGRQHELDRLLAALDRARSGHASRVVIHGEPGIGKSSLLRWAELNAAGMLPLTVRGHRGEKGIPYAGTYVLVRSLLPFGHTLSDRQRRAIEAVIGLESSRHLDPLAAYGALLSLLGEASGSRPILLAVDDFGDLDDASRRMLGFVIRRISRESIAVLVAARDEHLPMLDGLQVFEEDTVPLHGLSQEAAVEYLRASSTIDIPRSIARRLAASAGGNPLALAAFRDILSAEQLSGQAPLPAILPVAGSIERSFRQRLAALAPETIRALTLLAVADESELDLVRFLASGVSPSWSRDAEMAGVIRSAPVLAFVHPLMRLVLLNSSRVDRSSIQEAHRQLAAAAAVGAIRTWHLAEAAEAPDDGMAEQVAALGRDALGRGAAEMAVDIFARAADLSSDPEAQTRLRFAAASAAAAANQPERSLALLGGLPSAAREGPLRLQELRLRGMLGMFDGRVGATVQREFVTVAREPTTDPATAQGLLAMASLMATIRDVLGDDLALADAAAALGSPPTPLVSIARAHALAVRGRDAEALAEAETWQPPDRLPVDPLEIFGIMAACQTLVSTGATDKARAFIAGFESAARAAGAVGVLVYPLGLAARLRFRSGDWVRGYADAAEALTIAEAAPDVARSIVLGTLAVLAAGLGRVDEADTLASQGLEIALTHGLVPAQIVGLGARGFIELSRGRAAEALSWLLEADRLAHSHGFAPSTFRYSMDLIEAAESAGRPDIIKDHVRRLDADPTAQTWIRATARRGEATVLRGRAGASVLAAVAAMYDAADARMDAARTRLQQARVLRRSRSVGQAHAVAAAVLPEFQRVGARTWVRDTERLLPVTSRAPRVRSDIGALTPAELQVAVVVARGLTNREAAAQLFLSERTVDHHLSHAYSKLGLRSRTELALWMSEHQGR